MLDIFFVFVLFFLVVEVGGIYAVDIIVEIVFEFVVFGRFFNFFFLFFACLLYTSPSPRDK